ncbi:MAG: formylglycine-generating enzyme family protein [Bacteroidales bacterium]|jgi:formylglycine-generating enzyme required for sulfatase activity|nr:formylglycine-generating enzyme family protein [Bacteroidales bacterium]
MKRILFLILISLPLLSFSQMKIKADSKSKCFLVPCTLTNLDDINKGNKANVTTYNPDGIEMVYVEGTGSGITEIQGFYIGKYEVTQAQWEAVMGNNPSSFKNPNNPVEKVSWDDVKSFISKLNSMTGRNYRLPTEKEWAYAANEGNLNSSYEYSGSNAIGEVAWYDGNSGYTAHPVGQKKPNALGIYDMSGNVWEWCEDCSDSNCSYRVYRGGGWGNSAPGVRVSYRNFFSPSHRDNNLGFRLVCSSN